MKMALTTQAPSRLNAHAHLSSLAEYRWTKAFAKTGIGPDKHTFSVNLTFLNYGCGTSKGSDQPAHMRSLIRAFASRLNILRLLGQ